MYDYEIMLLKNRIAELERKLQALQAELDSMRGGCKPTTHTPEIRANG
jgi:hypothetical protein